MNALASDLVNALDPVVFARDRLGFDPDGWQADVLRSDGRRLLLNCSRQSGKSTVAAVLALHTALYRPGSLALLVSPSLRQSGELFRKVTGFLARLEVAPAKTEDNKLSVALTTGSRIVSLPSTEGTVRGMSAPALIVEDEAARVDDNLYLAMRPMLAVSGGRLLLMSTPWGTRGHFYEEWANGGPGWERTEIPASACPRIPPAFLEEERRSLGQFWYGQEYEVQFLDAQSAAFPRALIDAMFDDEVTPWTL